MTHNDIGQKPLRGAALFDTALWTLAGLLALIASILAVDWIARADTFPVRAVHFEGEFRRVSQSELEAAVMPLARASFLRVDLAAVQQEIERLPWVRSASVRRAWPRDLYVNFSEQHLLARWNRDAWVNQALEAIQVPLPDASTDLPQLEGPDGTQAQVIEQYYAFSTQLAPAGLTLRRLALTPRRSWRLDLENGIELVLDREDAGRKLERFARSWPLLAREGRAIRRVDLRYTNGFAVDWKAGRNPGLAGEG